jgi:hypothetical protein
MMQATLTPNEEFIFDWGDGNTESIFGTMSTIYVDYDYPDAEEYTVTVTAVTDRGRVFMVGVEGMMVKSIDVTKLPHLDILGVAENQITSLDLSGNPALRIISADNNPLGSLDVSANPQLSTISCFNAQLTELDVRSNPQLMFLLVENNLLTSLDLSANPMLFSLFVENNRLTSLDISASQMMQHGGTVICYGNHISLSCLYAISEIIPTPYSKQLGPQTLIPIDLEEVVVVDFSSQASFGDVDTDFVVMKGDAIAIIDVDYEINGGVIEFLTNGVYTVIMSNEAIVSDASYPATVTVEITVDNAGIGTTNVSGIVVYPNPFRDEINVSASELVKSVQIMDVSGQKVKEVIFDGAPISTGDLATGIYFVIIETVTGTKSVHKMIKN